MSGERKSAGRLFLLAGPLTLITLIFFHLKKILLSLFVFYCSEVCNWIFHAWKVLHLKKPLWCSKLWRNATRILESSRIFDQYGRVSKTVIYLATDGMQFLHLYCNISRFCGCWIRYLEQVTRLAVVLEIRRGRHCKILQRIYLWTAVGNPAFCSPFELKLRPIESNYLFLSFRPPVILPASHIMLCVEYLIPADLWHSI